MQLQELGELVDNYDAARAARLEKEKEVYKLQEKETALKEQIIATMHETNLNLVGGRFASVRLQRKDKPQTKDWSLVYNHIKEHDAFDLLQRRLNEAAIGLRAKDGILVPGINYFPVYSLTISSLR